MGDTSQPFGVTEGSTMQAPSGQMTAPPVRALMTAGNLTGEWVLDPRKSSIRLQSRSMWGLAPVNGVFREVSGNGIVSPDGEVSGTVTVTAASIDTRKHPARHAPALD
jgi:polyisoprenoid-binding protein YceI